MQKELDKKIFSGSDFSAISAKCFNNKTTNVISFVNPFSYIEVLKESKLVTDIDYYFSDGAMLCKFHGLFNQKITRASFDFSSIANDFLTDISEKKLEVAVIGAKQSEIDIAIGNLKNLYPKMNIVFYRNGYIEDKTTLLDKLNQVNPQVIILGMGSPHQEKLAVAIKDVLNSPATIITCGGFLTQTSIKADYYHPLIKKLGLRWLQRMVMHSHVRNRVFKDYPKFVFSYLKGHLFS